MPGRRHGRLGEAVEGAKRTAKRGLFAGQDDCIDPRGTLLPTVAMGWPWQPWLWQVELTKLEQTASAHRPETKTYMWTKGSV